MNLHERLSAILREQNVSQIAVANALRVAASTVSGWMKGSSRISEVHLARIVDELFEVDAESKRRILAELFVLNQRQRALEDKKATKGTTSLAGHAFEMLLGSLPAEKARKKVGRTLMDFPDSFYPLVVVEGDKREQSESRINVADFGAVSASPAETRWVSKLQLRDDVEFLTDKVVVLETIEQLRNRFGKKNLLVIGSPGSNHLARRLHLSPPRPGWRPAAPIFRFNLPMEVLDAIEQFLKDLDLLNPKQLVGRQGDPATERQAKQWLKFLFAGGFFCPTGEYRFRAAEMRPNRDFGLITLARNPFSETHEFVSILVAGFHMMATAHAIKMLANPANFENHPVGGVIKVEMREQDPFGVKFDDSKADWDTGESSNYNVDTLRQDLERLKESPSQLATVGAAEFAECLAFLGAL